MKNHGAVSGQIGLGLNGYLLSLLCFRAGFLYSRARCFAFNAHVNHIATAAAAVGKSCHGRRRMSGVANAQFGNHDATKSARLRTCHKMFLIYGALLGGDILTSAKL